MIMKIDTLYYVVRKVILPSFPWIHDFVWNTWYSEGWTYYTLEITPIKDFPYERIKFVKELVEDEMYSIFKVMGPESNEVFNGVVIV